MIFLSSGWFSYSQAKLTSCLFQPSCCIWGLCQLSILFNPGQQDTDSAVADIVVFLHFLHIASFHHSHAFCYRQQPYHGGNESPVLGIRQWWAKLHGLCNLLLSQCCRCDLWMPLISMAFMKLTEWDEIAFHCARSLLWDKRAVQENLSAKVTYDLNEIRNWWHWGRGKGERETFSLTFLHDFSAFIYMHHWRVVLEAVFFNASNAKSSYSN